VSRKPLRPVTRKCATCERKFQPARGDARYCSGACRQRAHRARARSDSLDREIEATRRRYWELLQERAIAQQRGQVLSDEAQFVDEEGKVFMHGEMVGRTKPIRPGWSSWGAEAGGAPWAVPPGKSS
jgi:Bacteriophage Lambda NinG protein